MQCNESNVFSTMTYWYVWYSNVNVNVIQYSVYNDISNAMCDIMSQCVCVLLMCV